MTGLHSIKRLTSFQIIILGFAGLILFGALLLTLPISSQTREFTRFSDALFTAVSAVCVTGLIVKDTASYWSYFGQAVILLLIQIGGLGVITVASFITILSGKKLSLMQRQTIQNALSIPQLSGTVKHINFILKVTFSIELLGTFALLPVFVKKYGPVGIWMSVFHSVSAFCNAGFDIMGSHTGAFTSLTSFSDNAYVVVVICLLIILGGIGFITWRDIATKRLKVSQYMMQTKVILGVSFIIIVVPFLIFYFNDFASEPITERFCNSLFQAITPRTAGFNTADLSKMSEAGQSIIMVLMLIGGAPGSTAGGMKMTTIAILIANVAAVFRMKQDANLFKRRLDEDVIKTAATIFSMYVVFAVTGAIIISIIEQLPIHECLFETMSAIGTAGLTLGITTSLGLGSKIILMLLMYFGRVGILTLVYAAIFNRNGNVSSYPVENIMVG